METTTEITQERASGGACATFTVEQAALVNALTLLAPAVAKRSTMPILQNVKFEAFANTQIIIKATNLEIFVKQIIPANVSTWGAFTVDYKELLAVIKPLKKAQLTFTLQRSPLQEGSSGIVEHVCVSGAGMTVTLPCIAASEFPWEPTATEETRVPEQHLARVPVWTFRRILNVVAPAASEDTYNSPTLTGVHLCLEQDQFTVEATDKFRIHRMHTTVFSAGSWLRSLIVDARSLFEVVKRLPKTDEVTLESHTSTHATLTCGNVTVHFRLIEGTYPNTEMAIPRSVDMTRFLRVDCAPLKTAIDALAPIAKDSSNIVRLCMAHGALIVSARRDGMDEPMRVSVPAIVEGKASEVCFDYRYLLAVLGVAPTSTVICAFSQLRNTTYITLDTVPGFEAVVMPMDVR